MTEQPEDKMYRVHIDARISGQLVDGWADVSAANEDEAFNLLVERMRANVMPGWSTANWRMDKIEPTPKKQPKRGRR